MRLHARLAILLGRVLNWLGAPGFVRNGCFESLHGGVRVRVFCGELFTIVSVNGTDVYFDRLGGRLDGVGSGRQVADRAQLSDQ
jgi:hypothetical protein